MMRSSTCSFKYSRRTMMFILSPPFSSTSHAELITTRPAGIMSCNKIRRCAMMFNLAYVQPNPHFQVKFSQLALFILPIHIPEEVHWILIVVDFESCNLSVWDSWPDNYSKNLAIPWDKSSHGHRIKVSSFEVQNC